MMLNEGKVLKKSSHFRFRIRGNLLEPCHPCDASSSPAVDRATDWLDGALEATEDDEPGRLPQSQTWEKDGKGIKKLNLEIPGVQPVRTIKLRDFRNLKQLENHQRLRLSWFLVISANSSFPRVHEFRAYINLDIACLFSRAREIPGWNNQNMYTCLWTFDEVQNNSKNDAKRKTFEFIIWVRTKTPLPCSSHYNS